jgi:hypothetical protein
MYRTEKFRNLTYSAWHQQCIPAIGGWPVEFARCLRRAALPMKSKIVFLWFFQLRIKFVLMYRFLIIENSIHRFLIQKFIFPVLFQPYKFKCTFLITKI